MFKKKRYVALVAGEVGAPREIDAPIGRRGGEMPPWRICPEGRAALSNHRASAAPGAEDPLSASEYLAQALDGALAAELSRRERGLTLLASVGSSAPFVGLFGTVWGVYGALVQIGLSGQGTLDKVAGPVGEALIMTAAGLGVAIPAVLAYNAFQRGNRISALHLERDAHRLLPQLLAAPLPLEGPAATGGR